MQLSIGFVVLLAIRPAGCTCLFGGSWLVHIAQGLILLRYKHWYLRYRSAVVLLLLLAVRVVTALASPSCIMDQGFFQAVLYKSGLVPLLW